MVFLPTGDVSAQVSNGTRGEIPANNPKVQQGRKARGKDLKDGRNGRDENRSSGLGNYLAPPPVNNVPEQLYNVVLGRPTDRAITIRVLVFQGASVEVVYGTLSDQLGTRTKPVRFQSMDVHDFVLDNLEPNQRYYYRLVVNLASGDTHTTEEFTFHTQRQPGSPFVFSVTADSHLDENTSGEVYLRTLANALSDQPDFHLELGDTFMTGKYVKPELSEPQYLAQRYFLGSLCHSAPLFFVLGNHDGESGSRGSMVWATRTRKRLFPNPEPGAFFTGNEQREPEVGFPQNYYQWKWGDAQFLVLDPFRYTTERSRNGDNWSWTLGREQYLWLKTSLESVDANYRFVFLHHLVGGAPTNNRGGVEVVPFWEWGGKGRDGDWEFSQRRPGWELPIHDLLVKHGVSVVFHGHDHLFVKQDFDGIVYQEVPQPGHPRSGNTKTAQEYGYLAGEIQSSSGFVRVRVGKETARVDYVRTYLQAAESSRQKNGEVGFSYSVPCQAARTGTSNQGEN